MINTRDRGLYTPGSENLPKAEIVNFKQDVQDKHDALESRRRNIHDQRKQILNEIDRIYKSIGQVVVENGAWQKDIARAGQLQLEIDALDQGILYIDGQIGLLKRSNYWLNSRR
jgi:peptidoglycan hydrolase CwlO-like protein